MDNGTVSGKCSTYSVTMENVTMTMENVTITMENVTITMENDLSILRWYGLVSIFKTSLYNIKVKSCLQKYYFRDLKQKKDVIYNQLWCTFMVYKWYSDLSRLGGM